MDNSVNTILLIDDDQDDIYFFHTALQQVNEEVQLTTASNGVEAIEKLQFSKPDLILLDLIMPRMNGVVFLQMIKRNKDLCDIPVIIYTTDLSIFQENELIKLGAKQIIIKPVDFEATVNMISSIIEPRFYKESA